VPILPGEENNDPVKEIPISYADLDAGSQGTPPVSVNVSYTVQRGSTPFPTSPATPVKVDLTIVGGPDPDPETPENENLKAPDVYGASNTLNTITAADYGQDGRIVIPWQTVDLKQTFLAGDILRVYWGANTTPAINLVITTPPTTDTSYVIPLNIITGDATGDRPVWYTVTRTLSTAPHISTAKSSVQTVKVESNIGHPGDGNPLAAPTFPEAKGTAPNLYIDRAAGLDGTDVRCPLTDTNIAAGDSIIAVFSGYTTSDGTGTPSVTFTSDPRIITGPEFAQKFADIAVPTGIMRQLCRGSARAQYTVTNAQGTGSSTVSGYVLILLYNATDPVCALPFAPSGARL
jgi:hypothetical protein